MPFAKDEAGHIWEVDAQGNAVRLVQQGGQQPQMPANPEFPYKGPQAAASVGKTQADTTGQQIDNRVKGATAPAVIAKTQAEADKAVAEAAQAKAQAANQPDPRVAEQSRALQLDEVLNALDHARSRTSAWSTGLGGQILQPIGGTQARDLSGDLSTIGSALTIDKLQAMKSQSTTGASGMGALSEKEGELLRDSVAGLDQAQSQDKVKQSLDAIEMHYRRLQAIQAGQNPDDPNVQRHFGIPTPGLTAPAVGGATGGDGSGPLTGAPHGSPGAGGPAMGLATGDMQSVEDPARAGLNARVAAMVKAGANGDQIRAFLTSAQIDPKTVGGIDEAVAFRHQYPAYKGDYSVNIQTKEIPLGAIGSAVNQLGQSGVGAYFANAADALSAGTLDNMTSNPTATRAAMDQISGNHPYAALGGMLSGGAMAATGLEAGAGALGMGAKLAPFAADAAYGGAYGAGSSDDGDRLTGALYGAGLGAGGGLAGRGITKAVGGLVRGVTDPYKQLLNQSGVRMTIPQMAGGGLKSAEDRLAGLPLVGGAINGGRAKGLEDFRRAAFNEGLAPIGGQIADQQGEQAVQTAQDAVSGAFNDALGGVTVQTDPAFKAAMPGLEAATRARPRIGPEVAQSMSDIANPMFGPGGTLRGVDAQPLWQGLEQLKAGYRRAGDPLYATQIAPSIDAYGDQVEGLFQRQAPGVLPKLTAAKAANRNVSTLQDAVLGAAGKQNGDFTPPQLMAAVKANNIKFGGKRSAATGRGNGLFGLARAGNKVLPNNVPDSGTAGRLAMYGLLGGGYGASDYSGGGENASAVNSTEKALLAASALALGGKALRPGVQKIAFGARSPSQRWLGDYLLAHPQLGGGALLPMLPQFQD